MPPFLLLFRAPEVVLINIIQVLLKLTLTGVMLLSLSGSLGRSHKLFELTSHFKAQYLIASFVCLLSFFVLKAWPWAACALTCFLLNLSFLLPVYFTHRQSMQDLSNPRLKVIQANVLYANTNYSAFIDFVEHERPDVLIVQEVTAAWLNALQALRGYESISRIVPEDGGSGIALYSRIPLRNPKIISMGDDKRPGIAATVNVNGSLVSLLTIHTHAPLREGHFEYRNEQLAAAVWYVRHLPSPKIFVGDLNTSLWSPYYSDFMRETGLVDAREGFGVLPSWPTFLPFGSLLMIPIDHCLVSPDVNVLSTRTGADIGSDHLPLIIELEVPASAGREYGE